MSLFTSWVYPLSGIVYMATTPQLWRVVLKFVLVVTLASATLTVAWFHLAWGWHLRLLARAVGVNIFSKTVTSLLLLAESALPVWAIFNARLDKLQRQLFDATLAAKRVTPSTLDPADRQALDARLELQRRAEDAAARRAASWGLPGRLAAATVGLVLRLVLWGPRPHKESRVEGKLREVISLAIGLALPPLLPLLALRDAPGAAAGLLSRYWEAKGINSPDALAAVAAARKSDYTGFGLVAGALGYVPLLNWALSLTNMVGAGLYAAALEKKRGRLFH